MPSPDRINPNGGAFEALGLTGPLAGLDGHGVAIGFLDFGYDVFHPAMRDEAGRTRFHCIWDQNTGRLHSRDAIDGWIGGATREEADEAYDPHAAYYTRNGQVVGGAHGTLMASIAGGSSVRGFTGAAPAATLIGVQLALRDHHWKEQDAAGVPTWTIWDPAREPLWGGWRSYDASPQIVSGLDLLYRAACQAKVGALVVNLSIGASAGAHDGCSAVEQAIDDLARRGDAGRGPSVTVVAAAGNAGADDGHFATHLAPGQRASFSWRMDAADPTQNKLEIWYDGGAPLSVTLSHPEWGSLARPMGDITDQIVVAGRRIGIADHVRHASGQLSRVRLLLHPPYFPPAHSNPADEYRLDVLLEAASRTNVHAWVERDDGLCERSSLHPAYPLSTLTPLACARQVIAVAGYDQSTGEPGLFARSSLGPKPWYTRSGDTQAPLVAAPAVGIWGARSKSRDYARTTGTSAATALVSGLIARIQQRAAEAGRRLAHPDLVDATVGIMSRGRARSLDWSPRFGWTPPFKLQPAHRMEVTP